MAGHLFLRLNVTTGDYEWKVGLFPLLHCRTESTDANCFHYAGGMCSCLTNHERRYYTTNGEPGNLHA